MAKTTTTTTTKTTITTTTKRERSRGVVALIWIRIGLVFVTTVNLILTIVWLAMLSERSYLGDGKLKTAPLYPTSFITYCYALSSTIFFLTNTYTIAGTHITVNRCLRPVLLLIPGGALLMALIFDMDVLDGQSYGGIIQWFGLLMLLLVLVEMCMTVVWGRELRLGTVCSRTKVVDVDTTDVEAGVVAATEVATDRHPEAEDLERREKSVPVDDYMLPQPIQSIPLEAFFPQHQQQLQQQQQLSIQKQRQQLYQQYFQMQQQMDQLGQNLSPTSHVTQEKFVPPPPTTISGPRNPQRHEFVDLVPWGSYYS